MVFHWKRRPFISLRLLVNSEDGNGTSHITLCLVLCHTQSAAPTHMYVHALNVDATVRCVQTQMEQEYLQAVDVYRDK